MGYEDEHERLQREWEIEQEIQYLKEQEAWEQYKEQSAWEDHVEEMTKKDVER